ncbi:MAG: M23 family metallopeptidase [Flavobacteriales bacterium]|jgi:murein DD-endopeptidase MepM/ murein hydrolase activator NlpD|nr:M23 family metallopeptidase [Flavobacteriales bacterium]
MIFANIMQDKEGREKYWSKLFHKYRFVIMTDSSFEEKISVRLSRLNVIAFVGAIVFFFFFSTMLLVSYTPLSEYVPGKSSVEVQKSLIELNIKSDSLNAILFNRSVYLENINKIINGEELVTPKNSGKIANTQTPISFEKSKEDSLFRVKVEAEDKSSIYKKANTNNNLIFFTPLSGLISDEYNNKTKHFGIDLVAKEKSRISSVLDGTVIISHWAYETGYVIGVQHNNDYISFYKHNSVLLKSVGDYVNAGDHIAIIGNSGELSSGTHLHFELWHKGIPVNPENYISF